MQEVKKTVIEYGVYLVDNSGVAKMLVMPLAEAQVLVAKHSEPSLFGETISATLMKREKTILVSVDDWVEASSA